jgi:hypothetical protein
VVAGEPLYRTDSERSVRRLTELQRLVAQRFELDDSRPWLRGR